jgi:hypothetical protein
VALSPGLATSSLLGQRRCRKLCDFVALDAEGGSGPSDFPLLVQRKGRPGSPVKKGQLKLALDFTTLCCSGQSGSLRNSLTGGAFGALVVDCSPRRFESGAKCTRLTTF